jgi:hypothetical protein
MAFDPSDYCSNPKCGGTADACGCPFDHNTQDLMRCPHCNGQWWRSHGDTSTACLHGGCRRDGSVVLRGAVYALAIDENGNPIESDDPGDGELVDCSAPSPDTECGICEGCQERAGDDIEHQVEDGSMTEAEARDAHVLNGTWS